MTAMLRSRSFVATVLAAALVPVPGLAAPAAAPTAQPAPADAPAETAEPTPEAPPSDAPTDTSVPTDPPAEGDAADAADAVPVEEAQVEEKPPEETLVPEGPERPAEPTLGNGKFKAKGTGLMISGGVLLGLGIGGMLTSYFLTRCPDDELDKSFACKNRQHNTFAVPATAAAALLGAVLLAVGLTYRVRYKRWETWDPNTAKTALRPVFSSSGVGFKF